MLLLVLDCKYRFTFFIWALKTNVLKCNFDFPLVQLCHLWGVCYIVQIEACRQDLKNIYLSYQWIFCCEICPIYMSIDTTLIFLLQGSATFGCAVTVYFRKKVCQGLMILRLHSVCLHCLNQNSIFSHFVAIPVHVYSLVESLLSIVCGYISLCSIDNYITSCTSKCKEGSNQNNDR